MAITNNKITNEDYTMLKHLTSNNQLNINEDKYFNIPLDAYIINLIKQNKGNYAFEFLKSIINNKFNERICISICFWAEYFSKNKNEIINEYNISKEIYEYVKNFKKSN